MHLHGLLTLRARNQTRRTAAGGSVVRVALLAQIGDYSICVREGSPHGSCESAESAGAVPSDQYHARCSPRARPVAFDSLNSAMVEPVRVKTPIAPALCFWRLFCTALTKSPAPADMAAALTPLASALRSVNVSSCSTSLPFGAMVKGRAFPIVDVLGVRTRGKTPTYNMRAAMRERGGAHETRSQRELANPASGGGTALDSSCAHGSLMAHGCATGTHILSLLKSYEHMSNTASDSLGIDRLRVQALELSGDCEDSDVCRH